MYEDIIIYNEDFFLVCVCGEGGSRVSRWGGGSTHEPLLCTSM